MSHTPAGLLHFLLPFIIPGSHASLFISLTLLLCETQPVLSCILQTNFSLQDWLTFPILLFCGCSQTSGIIYLAWCNLRITESSSSTPNNALYHFLRMVLRNWSFPFHQVSFTDVSKVSWIKMHCRNWYSTIDTDWNEIFLTILLLKLLLSNSFHKQQYIMTKLFLMYLTRSRKEY